MATAKAFGSITIVDVTDIGEFNVHPQSDKPATIVYDPDTNAYNPTWTASNPLRLRPIVYYAGEVVSLTDPKLTIEWYKRIGIGDETQIVNSAGSKETITNGILTVSENQFNTESSTIAYVVKAYYNDPSFGKILTAVGELVFNLVKNSSGVRDVQITGENVFNYNSDKVVDKPTITLTATVTNTTIDAWQYSQDGGATWHNIIKSGTTVEAGATLEVSATGSYFSNGSTSYKKILIRVKAHNNTNASEFYYDIISILKMYDGANASTKVFLTLSNESQMIPCNSEGAATETAFDQASTKVNLYINGAETNIQSYSTTDGTTANKLYIIANGVTGTWNASSQTYNVTAWGSANTGDTASVTFKYIYDGQTATKVMSLVKVKTGADGTSPTIYVLDSNYDAIIRDGNNGSYNLNTVTFTAKSKEGSKAASSYAGYLKIYIDGTYSQNLSGTMSSGSKTISGIGSTLNPTESIRGELYAGSTSADILDSQTVSIITNGPKGDKGDQGINGMPAFSISCGNYADIIPVTNDYKADGNKLIEIPFEIFFGTQKIQATATPGTICNGISHTTSGANASVLTCTNTSMGYIRYNITPGTDCGSTMSGNTTLTFTIPEQKGVNVGGVSYDVPSTTVIENYSWTLSKAALDGTNGYVFQLDTPEGEVFYNGEGSLTVKPLLLSGVNDITDSASYKWYTYQSGYTEITTTSSSANIYKNGNDLIVKGAGVDSFISIKCEATYDGHTFTAYKSILDYNDPVQAFIYSSIGNQITNGNGFGVVMCKVTRNGEEIDTLPINTQFVTAKPSSMTAGEYYYLLDTTNKTATLYKASSATAWATASLPSTGVTVSYKWTYRDKDDNPITSVTINGKTYTLQTSGKVVYIDAELINKRITIDVEVDV